MSAPMAKDRLGRLRANAEADQMTNGCWVRELLADRDHWEEQATHYLDLTLSVDVARQRDIDRLRAELTESNRERDTWEKQVQGLLAVIHGDGGHHSERVGIAQSLADAHDVLPTLRAQLTESNRERDEARRRVVDEDIVADAYDDDDPALLRDRRERAHELGWGYLWPYPDSWHDFEESDQ